MFLIQCRQMCELTPEETELDSVSINGVQANKTASASLHFFLKSSTVCPVVPLALRLYFSYSEKFRFPPWCLFPAFACGSYVTWRHSFCMAFVIQQMCLHPRFTAFHIIGQTYTLSEHIKFIIHFDIDICCLSQVFFIWIKKLAGNSKVLWYQFLITLKLHYCESFAFTLNALCFRTHTQTDKYTERKNIRKHTHAKICTHTHPHTHTRILPLRKPVEPRRR